MKEYIARLPKWGQTMVAIGLMVGAVIALFAFVWFMIAADMSRPLSQMPWHYWPVITLFLAGDLFGLVRTRRGTNRVYEQSVIVGAVLFVSWAITVLLFFASLFDGST